MVENIANNPIQIASNNLRETPPAKPSDAKGFETYLVDNKTTEKPKTAPANAIAESAESLTSYMGQLKAISERQQF